MAATERSGGDSTRHFGPSPLPTIRAGAAVPLTEAPDPGMPVWDAKGHAGKVYPYSPGCKWYVQNTGVVAVMWRDGITSHASWRELFTAPPLKDQQ